MNAFRGRPPFHGQQRCETDGLLPPRIDYIRTHCAIAAIVMDGIAVNGDKRRIVVTGRIYKALNLGAQGALTTSQSGQRRARLSARCGSPPPYCYDNTTTGEVPCPGELGAKAQPSTYNGNMKLVWIFAAVLSVAEAQDAGMALSAMVHANTLRNTSKLPKEKLAEIDPIIAAGNKARLAGNSGEALKDFDHAVTVLEGKSWTPERAWSTALTLKADHYILKQGERVGLQFGQMFEPDEAVSKRPSLEVSLVPAPGRGSPEFLKTIGQVNTTFSKSAFKTEVTIPDVADGNYQILANFEGLGEKSIPVKIARELMARVKADKARAAKLPASTPELATALGHIARVEYADRGAEGEKLPRIDLTNDLNDAEQMLSADEKGKNPFQNRYGDIEKYYKSGVDGTYQPYRLYIPTDYNPSSSYPLLVILHGMGGDQNTMFDAYGNGALTKLAEQHSYLVVAPKGREPAAMYLGAAEQDVMDVLADVRRAYKVNPNRIYLGGHSMGAYGTWSVAADHPDMFAALAPISGGGDLSIAAKLKGVPQFVVHGDADPTVPVTQSRNMVAAMKKAGAEVKYVEVPGGNHVNVVVPHFAAMFEFFDRYIKGS